jgi:hypothetical protein
VSTTDYDAGYDCPTIGVSIYAPDGSRIEAIGIAPKGLLG